MGAQGWASNPSGETGRRGCAACCAACCAARLSSRQSSPGRCGLTFRATARRRYNSSGKSNSRDRSPQITLIGRKHLSTLEMLDNDSSASRRNNNENTHAAGRACPGSGDSKQWLPVTVMSPVVLPARRGGQRTGGKAMSRAVLSWRSRAGSGRPGPCRPAAPGGIRLCSRSMSQR